jgi:hypothetical protein
LVARFRVAEKFNAQAVHNAEGSKALADLLEDMAAKLDHAQDRVIMLEADRARLQRALDARR